MKFRKILGIGTIVGLCSIHQASASDPLKSDISTFAPPASIQVSPNTATADVELGTTAPQPQSHKEACCTLLKKNVKSAAFWIVLASSVDLVFLSLSGYALNQGASMLGQTLWLTGNIAAASLSLIGGCFQFCAIRSRNQPMFPQS